MNFKSATENERKRQELRQARQIYLEKAREDYEKDQRRKEHARQRGEDKWMLASVDQRIQSEKQSMKSSKKKKKEKKKQKRKKKKKDSSDSSTSDSEDEKVKEKSRKKKKRKKSSSSSDSDNESAWVEKSDKIKQPAMPAVSGIKGPRLERDDWMQAPMDLVPTVTRKELLDRKNKEMEELNIQKELLSKPGTHAKELNPYWKDGGTGLPEEKAKSSEKKSGSSHSAGLGDSGLSWLRKSYQRCVQQAEEEGRPVEELAAERWGSLKKIQDMIKEAEASVYGERKPTSERSRGRFMKPTDNDSSRRKYSRSRSRSPQKNRYRTSDKYEADRRPRSKSRDRYRSRRSRSKSPVRRNRSRSNSRERSRKRSRSHSRDRRGNRSRSRERYRRRSRSRSSDKNRLSSLKGKFIRPGEMDNVNQRKSNTSSNSAPAWKKKEFHKPVEETDKVQTREADRDHHVTKDKSQNRDERRRKPSSSSSSSSSSDSSDSSSEDSSDEDQSSRSRQGNRSEKPEPVRILSEKEMNDLGAKIVKAEIMGNQEQAAKLKAQLEAAREAKKNAPNMPVSQGQGHEEEDFVTLTRTDRSGLARPVPESQHPAESGGKRRRKKQKVETHTGKQGERTRYFDDDDKFDLKTLVEREKLGTAEDQNQMFARLAGRSTQKTDDDFQVDDVFLNKANRKQSESIEEQRDRAAAIHEHKKMASSLEKCNFCFGNVPKHLIIAIGTKVYLCLPNHRSLTEGHCLIVPMQHVASSTNIDEDVWSEIQVFRRTLTKMFADKDEDVVFMEMSMRLKQFPHMCIECVPMDKEIGDLAPIYFKKAIQESESEWASNKKVVDLSKKDIRHSVPKGFPYFAVDFGNQGGFAHVIEDELKFPYYFGREIIGGMVDADHRLWKRPPKENFDDQRKKVLNFAELWKPYDWTQNIAKKTENDSSTSSSDSD